MPISSRVTNHGPHLTRIPAQRNNLRNSAMGVLAGLSKLINALAPINQLPPEILGVVPMYHQEGRTCKELVTVSGVCSYWRSTFLATPSIWTRLDGRGVEKTQAWVRRSGVLPIQLIAETSPDPRVLEFLAPHFSRLVVVGLACLTTRDQYPITHHHLTELLRPNRRLRIIQIKAPIRGTIDTPVVMDGKFASLERLLIVGIQISFTNLRARNLRHAHIAGTFDPTSLLDFLEASPLLESLSLKLDPPQDMLVRTRRKVVLGKMKSLRFFYHGLEILQHLSLPPGGDVKSMEAISADQLDGATSGNAQLLSRAFDNLPVSRQADSLSFHITGVSCTASLKGPNGTLELVTRKTNIRTAYVTLLRLFAQNSFGSIRDLEISNLELSPRDFQLASDFVRLLDGLQSIVMHRTSASPWLLALGSSHCPQLRNLTFEYPSPWSVDYDAFSRFAKDRYEAGIPIQRLAVVNRPEVLLDAARVEGLRKYVSCVVWT